MIRVWDVAAEIKREQENETKQQKRKAEKTTDTQEKKPKEETKSPVASEELVDKSE